MKVRRIVPNVAAPDLASATLFYGEALGLDVLMDAGWIKTFGTGGRDGPQLSVATEGGSGTPVPDISIEVDDLDEALARLRAAGHLPVYGPANEPWGVRRAFVRDPGGKLVKFVTHR